MKWTSISLLISHALVAQVPAAAAQDAQTPDALVEQLMAAFPDTEALTARITPPSAPAEVRRLATLNPGRKADVDAVMSDWVDCVSPEIGAATARGFHQVIRSLGARKTRLLIEFYRGPDLQTLTALQPRLENDQTLTADEQRTVQRILSAYPLEEWADQIDSAIQAASQDQAFTSAVRQCSRDKQAALTRRRLRFR